MERALMVGLLVLLLPSMVLADMGMISMAPVVTIEQPGQKAIVAWNGREEVIILSTDVRSSNATLVVEMIPLPSNPEVRAGSFDSFIRLASLIHQKLRERRLAPFRFAKALEAPGVEITFHERIGAHEITVVRVNRLEDFLDWVRNFTLARGLEEREVSPEFKATIQGYLARGMRFFVFDAIELTDVRRSKEPIVYRFASDRLFYPFAITATSDAGWSFSSVNLFLITKGLVDTDVVAKVGLVPETGLTLWADQIEVPQIRLTLDELSEVEPQLADLFERDPWVMSTTYVGLLSDLRLDLEVRSEDIKVPTRWEVLAMDVATMVGKSMALGTILSMFTIPDPIALAYAAVCLLGIYAACLILFKTFGLLTSPLGRISIPVSCVVTGLAVCYLLFTPDPLMGGSFLLLLPLMGLGLIVYLLFKSLKQARKKP